MVPVDGGSKGPRGHVKPGIALLAEKTGALLIPVACAARPAYTVRSWDRMVLPLPFATVTLHLGRAQHVDAGEATQRREQFERALLAAQADCDHAAYAHRSHPLQARM